MSPWYSCMVLEVFDVYSNKATLKLLEGYHDFHLGREIGVDSREMS